MTAGRSLLHPAAHTAPAPPTSSTGTRRSRLKPWLEDSAKQGQAANASTTNVFANHGIAWRASPRHHAAILRPESDKGHDLGQLASATWAATIAYEDLCGKGPKQIGFDQVDVEPAALRAGDADVTLRVHATWVLHPASPANAFPASLHLECRPAKSSGAWSATASWWTPGLPARATNWDQKIMALEAELSLRTGRPALQPGVAPQLGRNPLRAPEGPAGQKKTRYPFRRRGAFRAGAGPPLPKLLDTAASPS